MPGAEMPRLARVADGTTISLCWPRVPRPCCATARHDAFFHNASCKPFFFPIGLPRDEMGTSMKRGVHCVVWGSLASVLYAGPPNLDRDVQAAPAQPDANPAVAQPVVA